jgi:hypothetical protein
MSTKNGIKSLSLIPGEYLGILFSTKLIPKVLCIS